MLGAAHSLVEYGDFECPYCRSAVPVIAEVRARMGGAWYEGCPVPIEGLRYVTLSFVGFDGRLHTGELVVHASVAEDVVQVFRALFDARFPIE